MHLIAAAALAAALLAGYGWHRALTRAEEAERLADHLGRELDLAHQQILIREESERRLAADGEAERRKVNGLEHDLFMTREALLDAERDLIDAKAA